MAMLRDPAAPPLPDWLLDDLVRRAPTGPTARMMRDIPGLVAHMLIGRLGEVKTPADLLWGAADQLMKTTYAEQLLAELPAARLTLLEHCGHIPALECAPAFVAALDKLLAAPAPAGRVADPAAAAPAGHEPAGMISADVLGERARLTPDAPALVVVDPPLRLSYRELDDRARRAALALRELGVAPDDRVALLADNRVEFLDLFFAAGKGACVLVPARHAADGARDRADPRRQRAHDAGLRRRVRDARRVPARAARGGGGRRRWIALDAPLVPGDRPFAELAAATNPAGFLPARRAPEDLYCLLYTSGTTGRPKGVMIPHRQVAWNGYNTVASWQLTATDVSPIFTPLYHAGGLFAFLVPIITIGGTIVLHRDFDPAEIWSTVERERCTVILGVPTIWKLLAEAPEFAAADLSSVRCLYSGGAPLPTWIAELYQRARPRLQAGFRNDRGRRQLLRHDDRGLGPQAGLDRQGDDAHRGPTGRRRTATMSRPARWASCWFRGPHVSLGYWRNPEATAAAYGADGWFRSGDLARRDDEGFFTIAGRAKEMIISGGVNVYPGRDRGGAAAAPGRARRRGRRGRGSDLGRGRRRLRRAARSRGSAELRERSLTCSNSSARAWRASNCRRRSSRSRNCRAPPMAR